MLDIKDLEKFLSLPPAFNAGLIRAIEYELEQYDTCVGCIVKALDEYGENAYKDSAAYNAVDRKITTGEITTPTNYYKTYAVLKKLREENCRRDEVE